MLLRVRARNEGHQFVDICRPAIDCLINSLTRCAINRNAGHQLIVWLIAHLVKGLIKQSTGGLHILTNWCPAFRAWTRSSTAVQVVYLTFERLWNLVRETFAPFWYLSKIFIFTNLVINQGKGFDSKIFKIGDPMGLRLNMAVFEIFECVEPLRMIRVQAFLLNFDESWIILSDQWRNHHFEGLNQSISVQGAPVIRRPNIRTFYPMHGSSQPLVFREDFRQIHCSQSVKMEIWCCKEKLPNLRDTKRLLIQVWILETANCVKNDYFKKQFFWKSNFYWILVLIT